VTLAAATFLPPALMYSWARYGIVLLVPRSMWASGEPYESIYLPIFMHWPFIICTTWLAIEAVVVITMVMIDKCDEGYLVLVPVVILLWVVFALMMMYVADQFFP
jgi:hypothetical protein